ncbi:MAG: PAS domain S-box protein [Microcoleus vaginatus WJT46-NPBG5]|nr:PAS domain S-box protein [Microcoleus vaginatus WJT46-NPBG5]
MPFSSYLASTLMPHGHCYLWKPELVAVHFLSDFLIALAYYIIALSLGYFVRQRSDVPFSAMFWLFGAFIAACGTTHLMEVWTLWHPSYWLSGGIKAVTATVSLYTAVALFPLIPQALALASPAQLRAANEKLAQEIQAHQRTEEALRESEARFRSIFESAAIGIALGDLEGQILETNSAFQQMLGYSESELRGMGYPAFTAPDDLDADEALYRQLVAGERDSYQLEKLYIRSDRQLVWANLTVSPIRDAEGMPQYTISMVEDIRQRKQAEEEIRNLNAELEGRVTQRTAQLRFANEQLETRARQQRAVAQVGQRALAGTELSCLMDEAVALVAETLQVEYCNVLELLPEVGAFLLRAGIGWQQGLVGYATVGADLNSQAGYTLHVGEPVIVEDLRQETRFTGPALLHEHGVIAGLSVTIAGRDQPFGVLGAHTRSRRQFTQDDIYFLQAVANVLSTAIERQKTEEALRSSEEKFRQLAENITEVFWIAAVGKTQIIYVSPAYEKIWGRSCAELYNNPQTFLDSIHPEDVQSFIVASQQHREGKYFNHEYRIIRPDGSVRWIWTRGFPVRNEVGEVYRTAGILEDITERKQMEQALFQEKELAQVTLQSIGDAVITTDALGKIVYLNPIAEKLTGWKIEDAKGLPLIERFRIVDETTREPAENPVETVFKEQRIVGLANHTLLISRHGKEYAIEDSAAPIQTKDGQILGVVLVFRDVTERRNLAHQLSWQASHDPLTGLANRREFEQYLEQCAVTAATKNQQHTLCFLDLDRFKIVNDTCGHVAGDELLRQVSSLLQSRCRKTDILARFGGDEFALLLTQCSLEKGRQVAQALLESFQEFRFMWQEKTFNIGASIGLVTIDAELMSLTASTSTASLLSAADAACYAAKNRGRNRVHIYQPNDSDVAQQRSEAQWVTRINKACEEHQFCLYFQPISCLTVGCEVGEHYEVLLRLVAENGDLIPPMAFLPAAERYNLMPMIDRWVINKFFAYLSYVIDHGTVLPDSGQWRKDQPHNLYAINLSGASVNDDEFIDFLQEQFSRYQIPPQAICFEITETVAISNLTKAAQLIRKLKALGCQFALDDFGTGMSSFAYLKSLPVDYLKIDGNFVKDIADDPIDFVMVEAINRIGHVMGLKTIAEFVSDEIILEKIKSLGVDYAQGYEIAMPQRLITVEHKSFRIENTHDLC